MRKRIFLGGVILIFALYLVYSYNNLKGESYIFEPFYLTLVGDIPEKTSLEFAYQTINDPTKIHNAHLISNDSIPANTYIFKIDSSYRLANFSIYFQELWEGEEITISQIQASNDQGGEFSFSLKSKDLSPSQNLRLEQLSDEEICIRRIPYEKPIGSALYFNTHSSIKGVFVKTKHRAPEIPSLAGFLAILLLGMGMAYTLYPVVANLKMKGISTNSYLLALAILIMPSGEKICNLIIALAIVAGIFKRLMEGTLPVWIKENQKLLVLIVAICVIYLIAYLFSGNDQSSVKLLKIKYGLPFTLLAVTFISKKQEIRIQYAALIAGVVFSILVHFGWAIMLIDVVELKSKLFANPHRYFESAIFSRVHHSYLSVLYLASLVTLFLKKDIITLRQRDIVVFSILIVAGLFFAFSRAAILSLLLILGFFSVKRIFHIFNLEITRVARFIAASILTISLLALIFGNFNLGSFSTKSSIKGLSIRTELWEKSTDIISQKPLFGWGPGSYKNAMKNSNSSSAFNTNTWRVLNTHNQFLETTGMFGLPVGIGLAWLLFFPTGLSRQASKYSDFIITAAIIFVTGFFFESFLNRNLGILIFGLIYGLLIKMKAIYGS